VNGGDALALLDATLTGAALVAMVAGRAAIKRGDVASHRRRMLWAVGLSAGFLVSFVTRIARYGVLGFQGEGAARGLRIALIAVHDGLAVVVIPLVLVTVSLGLRGRYRQHREVARVAWPIWVYVSVTGLLVYVAVHVLGQLRV
jgi:putative membrane protein